MRIFHYIDMNLNSLIQNYINHVCSYATCFKNRATIRNTEFGVLVQYIYLFKKGLI